MITKLQHELEEEKEKNVGLQRGDDGMGRMELFDTSKRGGDDDDEVWGLVTRLQQQVSQNLIFYLRLSFENWG